MRRFFKSKGKQGKGKDGKAGRDDLTGSHQLQQNFPCEVLSRTAADAWVIRDPG